jgi:GntR family transcriptional regulator
VPSRGSATITSRAASRAEARLLELRPGAPLLAEQRLIEDQHGNPLELTESRYAGERYSLEVGFAVQPPV